MMLSNTGADDMARERATAIDFPNSLRRALAVCMLLIYSGCSDREPSPVANPGKRVNLSLRGELPAARPSGYVGSDACRECHAELCDQYALHPMGRSLGALAEIETIEKYPSGEIDVGGMRKYRVTKDGPFARHHEYVTGPSGEVAYDQAEEVQYAIGSGQRGRAYLIFKDGVLRQSPIGWYSTGDRWDLSPGYRPDANPRFQRRVGDGCLYCHAGRVNSIGHDRYGESPFIEPAIGCERCHGPAAEHVALHREGASTERTSDPIVNPAKLDVAARESICNQCHLQGLYTVPRYGRSFMDFRPGDQMEDIFVTLIASESAAAGDASRVVSQVEQMRESQCYVGSRGQLGCISCHDPHAPPAATSRDAFYQERCNACHQDRGCSLPLPKRLAAPAHGSCVHCHMPPEEETNVPHTAQTDHRIPRRPSEATDSHAAVAQASRPSEGDLKVFGDTGRIPGWEQSRAKGIAMMSTAWNRQDLSLARRALTELVPTSTIEAGVDAIVSSLTPDIPALNEVGSFFYLTGNPADAAQCWLHVLELAANDETALAGMAMVSQRFSELEDADEYVDRLLSLTPEDPQWLTEKAKLAWQQGDRNEAFSVAEKLLRVDPTLIEFRQWLAGAYRAAGNMEKAEIHEETLRRLGR